VPGFDDKKRKAESDDSASRKKAGSGWTGKPADMERLAAGIEKLEENDLLPVVKLILENQTPDMYVKSDVDGILLYLAFANQQRANSTLISILWGITC
jgi:transcription initiation factor TFIID/TFIIF subunit